VGDSAFSCEELGRSYAGQQVVRPTPNPNFRRVDARISDDAGNPILTISTILGR
jgi:general secretion pathway protein I